MGLFNNRVELILSANESIKSKKHSRCSSPSVKLQVDVIYNTFLMTVRFFGGCIKKRPQHIADPQDVEGSY